MKLKTRFRFIFGLAVMALPASRAGAQQLLPGEREAVVTAIPGVIDAGTKWQLIWADFKTADGIVGTPDGGVIFAQEQSDTIRKLDVNDKEFVIDGVKVVCDKKSYLYLTGTTLDYVKQGLTGGFTFVNPQAKSACGCGESFSV